MFIQFKINFSSVDETLLYDYLNKSYRVFFYSFTVDSSTFSKLKFEKHFSHLYLSTTLTVEGLKYLSSCSCR